MSHHDEERWDDEAERRYQDRVDRELRGGFVGSNVCVTHDHLLPCPVCALIVAEWSR